MKYLIEGSALPGVSTDKKGGLTMFLVLIALGYAGGLLVALEQFGMKPGGIATYYIGDEAQLIFPKTYRGLLENAHFHLFSMAIIFLALTHLFLLCELWFRFKIWLLVFSFAGIVTEIASPWLIRYGNAAWAWLMVVSAPLVSVSSIIMVVLIIRELWFKKLAVAERSEG